MSGESLISASAKSAELDSQLAQIKGNIAAYQKLARKAGAEVRKRSRARIRQQKSLGGAPFAPRRNERNRRKMLLGLSKSLNIVSRAGKGGGVVLTWKDSFTARIATRHQYGIGEEWNPARAAKAYKVNYNAPCTPAQARALVKAGYRHPVSVGGKARRTKKLSAKALQASLTLGQAGLALRLLTTGTTKGKQSWRDTPPARAFLGVTAQDANDISNQMAQAILDKI